MSFIEIPNCVFNNCTINYGGEKGSLELTNLERDTIINDPAVVASPQAIVDVNPVSDS